MDKQVCVNAAIGGEVERLRIRSRLAGLHLTEALLPQPLCIRSERFI